MDYLSVLISRYDIKVVVDEVQLEKRKKILEWLSVGPFDLRHEELRQVRAENSGRWFLESEEFTKWATGRGPSCLLCTGIRSTLGYDFF